MKRHPRMTRTSLLKVNEKINPLHPRGQAVAALA
jgi:hypothetical protein